MLTSITATVPPFIRDLDLAVDSRLQARQDDAAAALASLELNVGPGIGAISTFLIRTESIASSKIEHVEASTEDFARALAGIRSNDSATSMVAASRAYTRLIEDASAAGTIELESLLAAHRDLMADSPTESAYAGRFRDMQNWIGGSDHSPIDALHIPPQPERVEALMVDLLAFANRSDIPVFTQIAIAHAQFESIHPFTDGNGRIGRALVGAILRRRGYTRTTTPPIASALGADQNAYFDHLDRYRSGDPLPIIRAIAAATVISSEEAEVSVRTIRAVPEAWRAEAPFRAGSAGAALLTVLMDNPVMSAEEAENRTHSSTSGIYNALDQLEAAGIIHQISERKRNRVWAVTAVLDELDDLERRIVRRARAGSTPPPR